MPSFSFHKYSSCDGTDVFGLVRALAVDDDSVWVANDVHLFELLAASHAITEKEKILYAPYQNDFKRTSLHMWFTTYLLKVS